MENERSQVSGFSAIAATAALSIIVLLASGVWRATRSVQAVNTAQNVAASAAGANADTGGLDPRQGFVDQTADAADSTFTDIGAATVNQLLGSYAALQQQGTYTPQAGQVIAQGIGQGLHPQVQYQTFDSSNIKTDPNTSSTRVLAYRSDLQRSLTPLLQNKEAEFVVFGRYIETGDKNDLTKLQQFAQNYRAAAAATALLAVPSDATTYHIAILNAMNEFAATLDAMATHADDPFAAAALLSTYNGAEHDMLTSFNALTSYFKQKT